jgi:hypothetical protein
MPKGGHANADAHFRYSDDGLFDARSPQALTDDVFAVHFRRDPSPSGAAER